MVTISVLDANDNSPHFVPAGPIAVSIKDNSPANSLVASLRVSDHDSGANAAIAAVSLTPTSSPFSLVRPAAFPDLVEVRTLGVVDRETMPRYQFEVVARDGGTPAKEGRVSISLSVEDINDNVPKFGSAVYTGQVFAASPAGTAVLMVKATDKDSGANAAVTYGLQTSPGSNSFALDGATGLLSVRTPFTLDQMIARGAIAKRNDSNATSSARDNAYTPLSLSVTATDGGSSALRGSAKVELTIREAASGDPRFSQNLYSGIVAENSAAGEEREKEKERRREGRNLLLCLAHCRPKGERGRKVI